MKKHFTRLSVLATAGILCSGLLFFGTPAQAQEEKDAPKKVRVKIYKNENGKVTETDTTMEISFNGQLPDISELREFSHDLKISDGQERVIIRKQFPEGKPVDPAELEKMLGKAGEKLKQKADFAIVGADGKLKDGEKHQVIILNQDGMTKFDPEKLPIELKELDKLRDLKLENIKLQGFGDSAIVIRKFVMVKVEMTEEEKQMLLKNAKKETSAKKIKDLNLESVNLYPNPTNGKFRISFTAPQKGNTTIAVMDITGREIFREELGNFKGSYEKEFDLSRQTKGTYFLQVIQGKQVYNKKVLLQ